MAKSMKAGSKKPPSRAVAKSAGAKPLTSVAKTIHKGGLHKSLGIPQGEKIPKAMIAKAAKEGGKIGKQARLAETFARFRKGKK